MRYNEFLEFVKSDMSRNNVKKFSLWGGILCYRYISFKLTFWFRVCKYLSNKENILFRFYFLLARVIYKHYQIKFGIDLPYKTKVGYGLKFLHFSGIVISHGAVIGNNCTIFQCVTIGTNGLIDKGAPIIGDNCIIGAGAKIIGGVVVGNNVAIGANAVVLKDVCDNAIVAGVPAKLIRMNNKLNQL